MKSRLRLRPLLALAAILLISPPAVAQYQEPYDRNQAPYDDDGIRQTVARVSWFQGEVSFARGDAPDDWQFASTNYPMTLGDRIWSSRGARMELQLRGATVYVGPETELAVLDMTRDVRQLSLNLGTATFRVYRLDRDDYFEVATPNVSVTFDTPGIYRIDVDEAGNSRVAVRQGRAWAAAAGGQVGLERGDLIRVWGIDRPDYDVVLARSDSWDRWVDQRIRRYRSVRSVSYVHPDIYGVEDLDAYGSWDNHAQYGSVWYPRSVSAGWEPYRSGRWIWRDPWGWTWLSSEPWGWAPYHYGRWALIRGRWGWIPVGPSQAYPGYSPALVGFVGGGSGFSFSISVGGFVGWFPLGPREPYNPWYGPRASVNVTNYNYAYRNRVTIVERSVFVGSTPVERALVRDATIVRQVSSAPVLSGPIPVLPTRESIRVNSVAVQGRASVRPPQRVAEREVVTRAAPPPPPPTFERKLEVIRESGGAPVRPDVSRRLSVEDRRGQKDVQQVRPAARSEVLLAPRGQVKESSRPKPLPPSATREPVTPDRPALGRDEAPPVRETPPRRMVAPAVPPTPERAPVPEPEVKRDAPPTRGAPEPWTAKPAKETKPEKETKPGKPEAARPPERNADRPAPTATPWNRRSSAPPPAKEPAPAPEPQVKREAPMPPSPPSRIERAPAPPARVEEKKPESKPDEAKPGKPETKEDNPKKAAPRPPKRGEKSPTPTPVPER